MNMKYQRSALSFKEVISEMKEYADDKYHGLFDDLLKKLMKKESYM